MTYRSKTSTNRQATNNKSTNDDDNCSVICYKDSHDGHVGVIRIRQQPVCSACKIQRGTLASYYKHIVDKTHRDNVKKLCDENRFVPSIYDQAIHLAFQNNFYYQSDKFHFVYQSTNEEMECSENDQMEINNENSTQKTTPRKRRNFQVKLIFQEKIYSKNGLANAQIREQLLKEMLTDRADDLAALPMEIYYTYKKFASEDIHHNVHKGSVVTPSNKDQLQMMLKEQQQEPFDNGQMSSAENISEDNGVEQSTSMTVTHEISSADILDHNQQSSIVDDIDCKAVLNDILQDVYSKSDEFKREQRFLSGLARRSFRKKNTFFCDLCNKFLPTEKHCSMHLNTPEHLDKIRRYQTELLPWRQAMQKSLITGKTMKEILDQTKYDQYKSTMALHLTPNTLCNRGRFCCAFCEMIFTDQWSLEKHLHSLEHQQKKTSDDHKELIVRYTNGINFPIIFKFNGITNLAEVPDDIKSRYQWRVITRAQLDEDINSFLRNYPFDTCEGATRLLSGRAARKQKSFPGKSTTQNTKNSNNTQNNQQGKRTGYNSARGGHFQTSATPRGTVNKRPFPMTVPPNKRFRADLNNSLPGVNRGPRPMRPYNMEQYNNNNNHHHHQPRPYDNNGNNYWPSRHPNDHYHPQQQQLQLQHHHQQQQRQEFFERPNFELRSFTSDNNRYYDDRPSYPMPSRTDNNFNPNQPAHFNNARNGYNNNNHHQQSSNYDRDYMHGRPQGAADYRLEQQYPPNRPHSGPINEPMHHIPNNFPPARPQQQRPPASLMQHQNTFNDYGGRNNNNNNNNNNTINPPYFSAPNHQQANPVGANGPSIRSYADYQSSSALTNNNNNNTPSPMYSPLSHNPNPIVPQTRTYDEFGLAPLAQSPSNSHSRPGGSSFRNDEGHYGNMRQQPPMETASYSSWHGTPRGGNNNTRGRGGSFQSNKQPGVTFSYSSQNKNNGSSMRGRGGAGRNARNFGSGR